MVYLYTHGTDTILIFKRFMIYVSNLNKLKFKN